MDHSGFFKCSRKVFCLYFHQEIKTKKTNLRYVYQTQKHPGNMNCCECSWVATKGHSLITTRKLFSNLDFFPLFVSGFLFFSSQGNLSLGSSQSRLASQKKRPFLPLHSFPPGQTHDLFKTNRFLSTKVVQPLNIYLYVILYIWYVEDTECQMFVLL